MYRFSNIINARAGKPVNIMLEENLHGDISSRMAAKDNLPELIEITRKSYYGTKLFELRIRFNSATDDESQHSHAKDFFEELGIGYSPRAAFGSLAPNTAYPKFVFGGDSDHAGLATHEMVCIVGAWTLLTALGNSAAKQRGFSH